MKKKILLLCLMLMPLVVFGTEARTLKYFKVGTEMGVGYQRRVGSHGLDASVNATILGIYNFFNAKCLYVNAPFSNTLPHFYWGIGGGIWHEINAIPMGGPYGGVKEQLTYPTFESMTGYQFFAGKKCKCFLQLQLAVPFSEASFPVLPGISCGIGF